MYGPSGTVQKYDAFCVLPVNILNEKVFVFLWFWYIILAILTGLSLIFRLATLFVTKFRYFLLKRQTGRDIDLKNLEAVFRRCQVGDWFVLSLVGTNVNRWIFREVIEELGEKIMGKDI